jgi:hypothetical protein
MLHKKAKDEQTKQLTNTNSALGFAIWVAGACIALDEPNSKELMFAGAKL